jgi:dihydroaeruginoic acid synthetase
VIVTGELLTLEAMRQVVADAIGTEPTAIDDDDDLIGHGIDSITVMRLASMWQRSGVPLKFASLIEKPILSAWWALAAERMAAQGPAPERVTVDETAPFELQAMQQAYWVGRRESQMLGGVSAHFYAEFDGSGMDPGRLERAIRALTRRHGMLRARFGDDGRQQILPDSAWPGVTVHDMRDAQPAATEELRGRLSHRRLAVEQGEVFDVQLSLLPSGVTRTHINIDMLVSDALSYQIILAELAQLYLRPDDDLPRISYSFPRYLAEAAARRSDTLDRARSYWHERLAQLPGAPQLPLADDPERLIRAGVNRRHHWVSPQDRQRLAERAAGFGVTLPVTFATAFAEVLATWSAEPRFLLNLPVFDREELHPDTTMLVGDFTNLLLLALDLSEDLPFAEQARRVQRRLQSDMANAEYPGVAVLRDLARERPGDWMMAPVVFTSAIGLGELFGRDVRQFLGDPVWTTSETPQVWIDQQVTEQDGGLLLNWDVIEELFPPGVIDAMFAAYLDLLGWLGEADWAAPPPALLPASQAAVRTAVNDTGPVHQGRLLHQDFFALAARDPGRDALLWGNECRLSYGELATRALVVAARLVADGVRHGDTVAVTMAKGPDQIAAVLGVLAAGAAYVPVGADQPDLRRDEIYSSAGVTKVLTAVPGDDPALDGPVLDGPVPASPDDFAYVIYTSGSTGKPKGVEVTHRAARNTIDEINSRQGIGPRDRVLAVSALDFDLSVYDIFGLLSVGGAVVLVDEQARKDARQWAELARRRDVTVWNTVPALLDMLLVVGGAQGLRLALVSGDWVGLDLPGRLAQAAPGCRLVALGGATEAAIWSNAFEVTKVPGHWRSIPYGHPLRGQKYRVVDGRGRDCPDFVPGELWIGGAGVARGYRGDPEQTAERFVEHDGSRWYRTGDLGRYWPDGILEFLGRLDHQVKINGHRVELGEIEAAVRTHPGVDAAVVVRTADGRLAALTTERIGDGTARPYRNPSPVDTAGQVPDQRLDAERALAAWVMARLLAGLASGSDGQGRPDDLAADRHRLPVAPEYRHVLDGWIDFLREEAVVVCAGPVVSAGPRWLSVRSAAFADHVRDAATGTGLEAVFEATDRAVPLLASVLAGDADPAVFLDDPILAPEAMAQSLTGADTCHTAIADALTGLARTPARTPPRTPAVAVLGARGGLAAAAILRGVPVGSVRCVLLDESSALLETARSRAGEAGHEVASALLDAGAVPGDLIHGFDAVIASNTLHRYPDPVHGVSLARTLLAPGGTLFLAEATGASPLALVIPALLAARRGRAGASAAPATGPRLGAGDWTAALATAGLTETTVLRQEPDGIVVVTALMPADAEIVLPAGLSAWVAARLPGHMVPGTWMAAPALPLSSNGKVDRRAVAALFETAALGRAAVDGRAAEPVRPGMEQDVADAWTLVLGTAPAGRDDGFFGAGGDSLLATRVIALLRERTGAELPMRDFFRDPTVEGLAAALAARIPVGNADDEEGAV